MIKLIKLFIIIFLLISIFQIRAFAQTKNQIECSGILQPENNIMATVGGLFKPSSNLPGEYFRALIVFAEFQSDNNVIDNWPKGQLPNWAYNLIDSIPSSSYRPYSLSDYFKKMSVGDFDFIGDVFPRIITLSDTIEYSITNQQVIDTLNKYVQDFKRYDNWKLVNGVFQFSPRNGDGYLDMLIIVFIDGL